MAKKSTTKKAKGYVNEPRDPFPEDDDYTSMESLMNKTALKSPNETEFFVPGHQNMSNAALHNLLQMMVIQRREQYYKKLRGNN